MNSFYLLWSLRKTFLEILFSSLWIYSLMLRTCQIWTVLFKEQLRKKSPSLNLHARTIILTIHESPQKRGGTIYSSITISFGQFWGMPARFCAGEKNKVFFSSFCPVNFFEYVKEIHPKALDISFNKEKNYINHIKFLGFFSVRTHFLPEELLREDILYF